MAQQQQQQTPQQNLLPATLKSALPEFAKLISLSSPGTDNATRAEQEIEFFFMHTQMNDKLLNVFPLTAVMAIKQVLKQNLSLDPADGLVYLKTRKATIKNENGLMQVDALECQPSANGLVSIYRQLGRILDVKYPTIIYDQANKVIGGYVELQKPAYDANRKPIARWEKIEFDEYAIQRLRMFSHNENARWDRKNDPKKVDDVNFSHASKQYTAWKGGPDPEFFRAKMLRHSLKKMGANPNEPQFVALASTYKPVFAGNIISVDADKAAMADEVSIQPGTGSESMNYTAFEVVGSKTKEPVSQDDDIQL